MSSSKKEPKSFLGTMPILLFIPLVSWSPQLPWATNSRQPPVNLAPCQHPPWPVQIGSRHACLGADGSVMLIVRRSLSDHMGSVVEILFHSWFCRFQELFFNFECIFSIVRVLQAPYHHLISFISAHSKWSALLAHPTFLHLHIPSPSSKNPSASSMVCYHFLSLIIILIELEVLKKQHQKAKRAREIEEMKAEIASEDYKRSQAKMKGERLSRLRAKEEEEHRLAQNQKTSLFSSVAPEDDDCVIVAIQPSQPLREQRFQEETFKS